MKRPLFFVLWLFLATTACAQDLTVTRVVDGDTYVLSDGQRVRLIGVDTPEKHRSAKLDQDAQRSGQDKATIQALGERASKHAEKLIMGRRSALSTTRLTPPPATGTATVARSPTSGSETSWSTSA